MLARMRKERLELIKKAADKLFPLAKERMEALHSLERKEAPASGARSPCCACCSSLLR